MTRYIALLRAINVGGRNLLPMRDLKALCVASGLEEVQTYIASGNVVFSSDLPPAALVSILKTALLARLGRATGVLLRSAAELAAVLATNPFADAPPNRTLVTFLDDAPSPDTLATLRHQRDERVALGTREIYVAYSEGMGNSRLVIPAAIAGTARNLNTVRKLMELASQ